MARLLTLTFGPALIVGLAYLLAHPGVGKSASTDAGESPAAATAPLPAAPPAVSAHPAAVSFVADCQRKREAYMKRLGPRFSSVVHRPFVLIGDVPAAELDRRFRETIGPADRALSIAYFDKPPTQPITVILLSGDEAYQECANRLDGRTRVAFAGFYERNERLIVINAATGEGTIAHELTHALAHFDFPEMPEWFDEGLASLHEEGRFSVDRLRITGIPNWRGQFLLPALQKSTLRPLETLIRQMRLRHDQQAVDYAHVRYFCLFLQERGLLAPYYRKFRAAAAGDPTGLRTLCDLFGVDDPAPIDRDFRDWALALLRPPGPSSK